MYTRARKCNQSSNLVHQVSIQSTSSRPLPRFCSSHVIEQGELRVFSTPKLFRLKLSYHNCRLTFSLTHNRQDGSRPNKGESRPYSDGYSLEGFSER